MLPSIILGSFIHQLTSQLVFRTEISNLYVGPYRIPSKTGGRSSAANNILKYITEKLSVPSQCLLNMKWGCITDCNITFTCTML